MNNIFIKKNQLNIVTNKTTSSVLYKDQVIDNIPEGAINQPDKEKQKIFTEFRWRFYEINNKEYCEISYKEPNKNRQYKNKNGEWVERDEKDIDNKFNQQVKKEYFIYSK